MDFIEINLKKCLDNHDLVILNFIGIFENFSQQFAVHL